MNRWLDKLVAVNVRVMMCCVGPIYGRLIGSICHFVTLSLLLTAGCDLPGKPNPADAYRLPSEITDFSQLYRQNCAGCHGAAGILGPAPPLNDKLFLELVSESELLDVISTGRRGTPMPAFLEEKGGTLTSEQVRILAHGIKSHWGSGHASAEVPPLHSVSNGIRHAGASVFARACAPCHGTDGEGGAEGRINDAALLQLMSDQVLRRYIITGRPDLGMPNYRETHGRGDSFLPLTNQDVDDLMAYILSWRQP